MICIKKDIFFFLFRKPESPIKKIKPSVYARRKNLLKLCLQREYNTYQSHTCIEIIISKLKQIVQLPLPDFLTSNNFQWILPCSQSSPPCLHSNSLSGLQFSNLTRHTLWLFVSSLTLLSLPQIQPKINNTNNKTKLT